MVRQNVVGAGEEAFVIPREGHLQVRGRDGVAVVGWPWASGLSPSSFWVTRLSPLDDGSSSRFYSQPHRGLPGDHEPRPHG